MSRAMRLHPGPGQDVAAGKGSCRDFAVLMMEAVRSLGLAADFVSGYLDVPENRNRTRVGGRNARLAACLPAGRRLGGARPDQRHRGSDDLIWVAGVRDPRQAVPVSGTWTGFPSDTLGMTVAVDVTAETATEPVGEDEELDDARRFSDAAR